MGPACKTIINNQTGALAKGLEEVLKSPLVRDVMLPAAECDKLLQEMVQIDLGYYSGGSQIHGGLRGILAELVARGVVTDEVWEVLQPPPPIEGA